MKGIALAVTTATGLLVGTAQADPGDHWREQYKLRAECDEKLAKADSRRDYRKELRECDKKLAEWRWKQREEVFKARQEAEKKWRERWDD